MLLMAASPVLLFTVRSGGREAGAPRIRAAKPRALTASSLRFSSYSGSSLSLSCASSPSPGTGDEGSACQVFDGFSIISPVIPWEADDIWTTYATYFFILHIPLSFGGLDVVAKLLSCSSLGPMTTVVSTIILQLSEFALALALLQHTVMPGHDVQIFFAEKVSTQRNWIKEAILGFGVLIIFVPIISILFDNLVGPKDVHDSILKEILSDNPASTLLCFFLYCVIAPLLEETIYRGFLLTALASSMKWWDAVMISSLAFSVAHLSGESFFQLFVIGCIAGLAYCRTGTWLLLSPSILCIMQ